MTVVNLSDEQWQMLQRLEAEAKRFGEDERLRKQPEAIELASRLVEQAYELKMPEQAIISLRLYVDLYDMENGTHGQRPWYEKNGDS